MEPEKASQPVAYPIPPDWRRHPELAAALRTLVEGARRVVLAAGQQPSRTQP